SPDPQGPLASASGSGYSSSGAPAAPVRAESAPIERRTSMSGRSALVIGGGVIGVSSAYYLARDGWEGTLLEKGEICGGSSYGNAGLIVPTHLVPLAAPGVWWQGVKWMLNAESPFYIKPRASLELARWLWRFRAACTPGRVRRAMPLLRRLSVESLELYRE